MQHFRQHKVASGGQSVVSNDGPNGRWQVRLMGNFHVGPIMLAQVVDEGILGILAGRPAWAGLNPSPASCRFVLLSLGRTCIHWCCMMSPKTAF